MPFFPDCYDEWGLYKITYDGDHKMYETLFEGTEEEKEIKDHIMEFQHQVKLNELRDKFEKCLGIDNQE